MTPQLERRYRRLMRSYPAAWLDRHGDDLLGTLAELTSPQQTRPSSRQTRGLLIGGWKARVSLASHGNVDRAIADGLMIFTILFTTYRIAHSVATWASFDRPAIRLGLIPLLLEVIALFLLVTRPNRWLGLLLVPQVAVTLAALPTAAHPVPSYMVSTIIANVVRPAVLWIGVGWRCPDVVRRPRSPGWFALAAVIIGASHDQSGHLMHVVTGVLTIAMAAITLTALGASPFDPRPAVIALLTLTALEGSTVAITIHSWTNGAGDAWGAVAGTIATVAVTVSIGALARRRARPAFVV